MFSRNLYEIEEVAILLFQSIQGKRKTESSLRKIDNLGKML
jgi:hypothetical protein